MKHYSFNESAEMYLKTVSELADGRAPVPISAVAERLGVSPVSATEMVHRLEEHGLLSHFPYRGVTLTAAGWQQAAGVVRSHRLWETFLVERLGLPWSEAHEYACRLEHAAAPEVIEALDAYLDHPVVCPHGNPIPSTAGPLRYPNGCPLTEIPAGATVIVAGVHPETDELLRYLAELDLLPGRRVELREIAPFHGPLVVAVGSKVHYLGLEAAAHLFVRPLQEALP